MKEQKNKIKVFAGWSILGFVLSLLYFLVMIWMESKQYTKVDFRTSIFPSVVVSVIVGLLFGWALILLTKLVRREGDRTKQLVILGLLIALMAIIIIFSSVGVLINLTGW